MKTLKSILVSYKSIDGFTLQGALSKSRATNKKVVIYEHGMHSNFFSAPLAMEIAQTLCSTNYDLFTTNNRGMGLITRFNKGKEKIKIGTALEKFEECIFDIDGAIKTMQHMGYKDIILLGQSTGCQKITYYQSVKKNKKVKGLILLSPTDDYNFRIAELGEKFKSAVLLAKKMIARGEGGKIMPNWASRYSPKRFLSYAEAKNVEADLFNYSGKMKHFSSIKIPILAIFGSNEEHIGNKTPAQMLKILKEKTNSTLLVTEEIKGDNHEFEFHPKKVTKAILGFLSKL